MMLSNAGKYELALIKNSGFSELIIQQKSRNVKYNIL